MGLQLVLLAQCHVITFTALVRGWQRKLSADIITVPAIAVVHSYVSIKRGTCPVSMVDLYNADSWFLLIWHQFDASVFIDGSMHEMYSLLQKYSLLFYNISCPAAWCCFYGAPDSLNIWIASMRALFISKGVGACGLPKKLP